MHPERFYTLTASCPDQVGIIARVAGFFAAHGGWLLESAYHADATQGRYFMRMEVRASSLPFERPELEARFADAVGTPLGMDWRFADSAARKRLVVLVSRQEHCLYDLLARWKAGELRADIPCVISNHEALRGVVEWHGIPFHHVPVPPQDKDSAFAEVHRLIDAARADTVVLARYMQVLPPALCAAYPARILNIHHSFLPSFAGARPYHQAFDRGVKLIGATCHYVTAELDEGPIIDQDVIRVDHSDSVDDMVRSGKDIEKAVLARGLTFHLEDRVLVHGHKTVVFR